MRLANRRQWIMGDPQPIATSEVQAYCALHRVRDPEEFDDLIAAMDAWHVNYLRGLAAAKAKPKTAPSARKGRRG